MPNKPEAFRHFLSHGWVDVHLDGRAPGVDLPEEQKANPHLVLVFGFNMPIPITDMLVTDDGLMATLSFNRLPHLVFVPWPAVYVMTRHDRNQGIVWREDIPPDVEIEAHPFKEPPQGELN